jgi:hypothetical protein
MTDNNSQTLKEFDPIQKKDDTQLRITIKSYKEHEYIDIREYWKPPNNDQYLPTKKGVTLPTDDTFDLAEVLHAQLGEAIAFLAEKESNSGRQAADNK